MVKQVLTFINEIDRHNENNIEISFIESELFTLIDWPLLCYKNNANVNNSYFELSIVEVGIRNYIN